jgi:MtN3 and saliva related transmembrane protein
MTTVEIIGYVAAIFTTICYIPQVWQTYRTKEVAAISVWMYIALTIGVGAWFVYAVMLMLWPMILCNGLCWIMIVSMLTMKLVYGKQSLTEMVADDVS